MRGPFAVTSMVLLLACLLTPTVSAAPADAAPCGGDFASWLQGVIAGDNAGIIAHAAERGLDRRLRNAFAGGLLLHALQPAGKITAAWRRVCRRCGHRRR